VLSAAAMAAGLARTIIFGFSFSVVVDKKCANLDASMVLLWDRMYYPCLVMQLLAVACLAHLGLRLLGGRAPALRVLTRQTMFFHRARSRVTLCALIGVLTLLSNREYESAVYIVIAWVGTGLFDMASLLSRSRLAIRLLALSLIANYFSAWLRRHLQRADCRMLGGGQRESLETGAIGNAAWEGQLLFFLAIITVLFRRMVSARRPISQIPRAPHTQGDKEAIGGEPVTAGERGTVTFYNRFEMRTVRTGCETHEVLSRTVRPMWSWRTHRGAMGSLEWAMALAFSASTLCSVVNGVLLGITAATTGDPGLRCFASPPHTVVTLESTTRYGMLAGLALSMVFGLVQWRCTVARPWPAIARYLYFSIAQNHLTLTLISVALTALSFFTAYPVGIVLPSIIFISALDAFSSQMVRDTPRRLAAAGVRVIIARSVCRYAFDAVVSPNLCSEQDRRLDARAFVIYNVVAALKAAYNVALLTILSRKVSHFQRPFIDFQLQEGVGFDLRAFFGKVDAGERGETTRRRHAQSVALRTRSKSVGLDKVTPQAMQL
jgi:hypothetical protein